MGKSGGAVFLLLYLVLVVLVGVTVMLGELALGRRSGKSAVSTYRGLSKKYTWLGYAGIVCGFCIMCFYFVLGGIVLRYAVGYFLAIFGGSEFAWSGQGTGFFGYFLTDTNSMILFFVLYILLNILVVSGGVQGGIEKFCNVGMPALFCLLVFIILYIACQPGARPRATSSCSAPTSLCSAIRKLASAACSKTPPGRCSSPCRSVSAS